jgi:hypothetical protein
MADRFTNTPGAGQVGPGTRLAAVTASDTVDIAEVTRGLIVATAGSYKLLLVDDTTEIATYLAAGIVHPFRVKRVFSTSAASTSGIVAVY